MGSAEPARADALRLEEASVWLPSIRVSSGISADKGSAAGVRGNNAIVGGEAVVEKALKETFLDGRFGGLSTV
jgi:hypothetical protein